MKLVGELKKQVEETKNKEEAKEVIEKAGMQLTDEELDNVTGGGSGNNTNGCKHEWEYYIDGVAGQLMKRCTKCNTSLPAILSGN